MDTQNARWQQGGTMAADHRTPGGRTSMVVKGAAAEKKRLADPQQKNRQALRGSPKMAV